MKYHFYSSVSLSILVWTTREDRCPESADSGMMKLRSGQRLIGSLSLPVRGGGPRFFCATSLISVPLLCPTAIHPRGRGQRLLFQTNAAAAFQGQASGS